MVFTNRWYIGKNAPYQFGCLRCYEYATSFRGNSWVRAPWISPYAWRNGCW